MKFCSLCYSHINITKHHIVPQRYFRFFPYEYKRKYAEDNTITICRGCHDEYNFQQSIMDRYLCSLVESSIGKNKYDSRIRQRAIKNQQNFACGIKKIRNRTRVLKTVADFVVVSNLNSQRKIHKFVKMWNRHFDITMNRPPDVRTCTYRLFITRDFSEEINYEQIQSHRYHSDSDLPYAVFNMANSIFVGNKL